MVYNLPTCHPSLEIFNECLGWEWYVRILKEAGGVPRGLLFNSNFKSLLQMKRIDGVKLAALALALTMLIGYIVAMIAERPLVWTGGGALLVFLIALWFFHWHAPFFSSVTL